MARNPSNVGHACETIAGVDVKDVFDSQGGTEQIATGGVNDTFGLASRARGLWLVSLYAEKIAIDVRRG